MSSPGIHRPLSAKALLLWQFQLAHELLEMAIEAVHRGHPTSAAAARYAQIVLCG